MSYSWVRLLTHDIQNCVNRSSECHDDDEQKQGREPCTTVTIHDIVLPTANSISSIVSLTLYIYILAASVHYKYFDSNNLQGPKNKGMDANHFNDDEDPPTLEDSDNEGGAGVAGAPRSSYATLPDPLLVNHPSGLRIVTVSHQAQLRQQAHAPVGLSSRINVATASSTVYSHPPRLETSNVVVPSEETEHHRTSSFTIPENGIMDSPTSEDNSSGWSLVETSGGTPPSPRSLHAAAVLNGVMYVFGGYDGISRVNTFHAFSFAEKRWSPVLPSTNSSRAPSPRDRHVAFAFGNSFYVHGGFDGTSRVSDFWGFDFSSMTWREVIVLAGRPPSPRHSHAAVVHRHSLYIFGGYDGSYK